MLTQLLESHQQNSVVRYLSQKDLQYLSILNASVKTTISCGSSPSKKSEDASNTFFTLLFSCTVLSSSLQVAEVTFNFWYRLSEALYKTENDDKIALFRPYFETLIEALCVHCRLEADAVSNQFVNSLTFVVKTQSR